jgi:acetyl-CoA C-acetyltransferase
MAEALEKAASDAGQTRRILERAESLYAIRTLSGSYADPALLVANKLGISPKRRFTATIGGDSPLVALDHALADISFKGAEVILITGAEAMYTRLALAKRGTQDELAWLRGSDQTQEPTGQTQEPTAQPGATGLPLEGQSMSSLGPPRKDKGPAEELKRASREMGLPEELGNPREPSTKTELAFGLDRPIHVFPLFENAFRYSLNRSVEEHFQQLAKLWASFARVAAGNPFAWATRSPLAEEIATIGPDNRMIAFPYPKLMTANIQVDMAAALVVCSLSAAKKLGVSRDKLVFPWCSVHAEDHWFVSERPNLFRSPALEECSKVLYEQGGRALGAPLGTRGSLLGPEEIDFVDLYSCFPCSVEIGAKALDLGLDDPRRPLTVTGGLTFAGGPGNNYVSHSIATMVERLRNQTRSIGLTTGLGWYFSKHALAVFSGEPPRAPWQVAHATEHLTRDPARPWEATYKGPAVVESYTVIHTRSGEPEKAIVACLTPSGSRAWGEIVVGDKDAMETFDALEAEEGCGRQVHVGLNGRVVLE